MWHPLSKLNNAGFLPNSLTSVLILTINSLMITTVQKHIVEAPWFSKCFSLSVSLLQQLEGYFLVEFRNEFFLVKKHESSFLVQLLHSRHHLVQNWNGYYIQGSIQDSTTTFFFNHNTLTNQETWTKNLSFCFTPLYLCIAFKSPSFFLLFNQQFKTINSLDLLHN